MLCQLVPTISELCSIIPCITASGSARRASRELYAGVIITARFERSSSSPASAPLVSPIPPFEPECSTCSA